MQEVSEALTIPVVVDDFLKKWRKDNNTEEAIYSSYHYDAMIAFAEHYHQSKVNSEVKEICRNLARICTPSEFIVGIDDRFEEWWKVNFNAR